MNCRVCHSPDLHRYLDLGKTPLANALLSDPNQKESFFPLEVLVCPNCFLSQLSIVVDPKIMFSHYAYRSSISKTFQAHCREMARACKHWGVAASGALVVDIASNDGCLLRSFQQEGFQRVMGVEPAVNIASIAMQAGIPTVNKFWGIESVQEILNREGPASLVTATNVFAHVDDIGAFVDGVELLLEEDGIFVLEVPYAFDLISHQEWDTIYHEHLSYFLLKPLVQHFEIHRLNVFHVERVPIHGGSLRLYVQKSSSRKREVQISVKNILETEAKSGLYDLATYNGFAQKVLETRKALRHFFEETALAGKKVVGFGATAKGNTLLNYCGIGPEQISFIVDDTPEKQNLFTPGVHIPIRSAQGLQEIPFDYLFLLAWNFKEEIMDKTRWFKQRGGSYLIPIPEVRVI